MRNTSYNPENRANQVAELRSRTWIVFGARNALDNVVPLPQAPVAPEVVPPVHEDSTVVDTETVHRVIGQAVRQARVLDQAALALQEDAQQKITEIFS